MIWEQHALNKRLLAAGLLRMQFLSKFMFFEWIRVFPLLEVLVGGPDGCKACLEEAGRDQQLVEIEEFGRGLAILLQFGLCALTRVTQELCDTLFDRIGEGRVFAFDNNQWYAVNKEHNIGHNVAGPGHVYAELIDDQEVIPVGVIEVDIMDALDLALVQLWCTLNTRAILQQPGSLFIGLHQARGIPGEDTLQIIDGLFNTWLIQPYLPGIFVTVDLWQDLA